MLSIHRTFRANQRESETRLSVRASRNMPLLAACSGTRSGDTAFGLPHDSALVPPVDGSIPSPQLMSLNTFNTFDVSDVPPAPPAADGMIQPPTSNALPSDLETRYQDLKRRMEALERRLAAPLGGAAMAPRAAAPNPQTPYGRTPPGRMAPFQNANVPMPPGFAPPPEPAVVSPTFSLEMAAPPTAAAAPGSAGPNNGNKLLEAQRRHVQGACRGSGRTPPAWTPPPADCFSHQPSLAR